MIRRLLAVFIAFVFALTSAVVPQTVSAETNCDQQFYALNDILFYDPCDTTCTPDNGAVSGASGVINRDYKGNAILSTAQSQAINENIATYQKAGDTVGIPWQMIAVIHLRETGLKRVNPANGQGIYQNSEAAEGEYPPSGTENVSDDEFLKQSIWAGEFLKGKATDQEALAEGRSEQVKDAFFGYNGRAEAYVDQAKTLGFTEAQGYEGSPYVMNKADADRDPAINPTTWGQIKTDGGEIEYPANNDYGAYVVYAALAGLQSTCTSGIAGTLREKIIRLAEIEYGLWQSGAMKIGFRPGNPNSFSKYTYDINGDWCAWFVSWILKEAGHPVNGNAQPYWSMVGQFRDLSSQIGFATHAKGSGYVPQPGDFVIYRFPTGGHINIVVGNDPATGNIITIGGNELNTAESGRDSHREVNIVRRSDRSPNQGAITHFIEVK